MFAPMFEDIFQPMFSDLFGLSKVCQAIRFNAVNNYGQLATRAIDPDGDNVFEFWSPENILTRQIIISQSNSSSLAAREFTLYTDTSGPIIRVSFGGAVTGILSEVEGYKANTLYILSITGTDYTLAENEPSNIVKVGTLTRGLVREPAAQTTIGARLVSGSPFEFYQGLIPYIRINNFYYAMDAVGQAIQPSLPAGNDMTLFNTVPEQWEEISCGLRPEA